MPLFTAATARENAAKAHAARRANFLAAKKATDMFPSLPQSNSGIAEASATDDGFLRERLSRVREQIARLDGMLSKETDPARLAKLAQAIGTLAEQERQLAGRPLPGSYRPAQEKRPGGLFSRTERAPKARPATSAPFEQEG